MNNSNRDDSGLRLTDALFRVASRALLPGLLVIVLLDAAARNIFVFPLPWAGEVGGLLLLLFLISAVPRVSRPKAGDPAGRHLAMAFFYDRMGEKGRKYCRIGHAVGGVVVSGLLLAEAVLDVGARLIYGERSEILTVPLWPGSAVIGLCAALMMVQYLVVLPRLWREGGRS